MPTVSARLKAALRSLNRIVEFSGLPRPLVVTARIEDGVLSLSVGDHLVSANLAEASGCGPGDIGLSLGGVPDEVHAVGTWTCLLRPSEALLEADWLRSFTLRTIDGKRHAHYPLADAGLALYQIPEPAAQGAAERPEWELEIAAGAEWLRGAAGMVSTDETREALCGVHFQPPTGQRDSWIVSATDGHVAVRLELPREAIRPTAADLPPAGLSFPGSMIAEVFRGGRKTAKAPEVVLAFSAQGRVALRAGDVMWGGGSFCSGARFPDIQKVVTASRDVACQVTARTQELIKACNRARKAGATSRTEHAHVKLTASYADDKVGLRLLPWLPTERDDKGVPVAGEYNSAKAAPVEGSKVRDRELTGWCVDAAKLEQAINVLAAEDKLELSLPTAQLDPLVIRPAGSLSGSVSLVMGVRE